MAETRPPFKGLKGQKPEEIFAGLKTPCYILDEGMLIRNGEILARVANETGCKILLAQKAFSNYDLYPVLAPYIAGTEASGLYEARLGAEEMPGKEVHVFCGAYREDEFEELLKYADHIVFNSPYQLRRFGKMAKAAGKEIGLRINPECSTQDGHEIYDPCAPGSRLGTTLAQWEEAMDEELIGMLDGLHFHTLCEQDSDALEMTLNAVTEKFGTYISQMKWLNMGGGHHITREDYDIERLKKCILRAQNEWQVEVYLEPGEACALNAGYLLTTVLDTLKNGATDLAILDMSAACHTPDVIEMPYRPPLYMAEEADFDSAMESEDMKLNGDSVVACKDTRFDGDSVMDYEGTKIDGDSAMVHEDTKNNGDISKEIRHRIRLGGPTCLAGDVIGDYRFDHMLTRGEKLLFGDMAIYSTCKNNTFNGMPLPSIWCFKKDGSLELLREFGYTDFKYRLGR